MTYVSYNNNIHIQKVCPSERREREVVYWIVRKSKSFKNILSLRFAPFARSCKQISNQGYQNDYCKCYILLNQLNGPQGFELFHSNTRLASFPSLNLVILFSYWQKNSIYLLYNTDLLWIELFCFGRLGWDSQEDL